MTANTAINHKIWGIAWPALLSNISIPLLGLVDTAILGHLDSAIYLGAVAIGASILSFVYWGFSFLRMGTTGLVAQAFGAGNMAAQVLLLLQSMVLALTLAALVMLSAPLWLGLGLQWMGPNAEVEPLSASYMSIRVYSAPAVLVTYAITGWFIGRQNTRSPMLIVVFTNLINIVLDFWFIVGLDMKSDGAAWATLVAEYLGCLLALVIVWRQAALGGAHGQWQALLDWQRYGALLSSNRYLFFRTICLLFSFAFFTAMGTRLGVNTLAANSILMQLLLFAAYALDGFAFAAEGLSGHALGARRLHEFHRAVRACWRWSVFTALGLSALFAASGPLLFPLFSDQPGVIELLWQYQGWLVAMPLVAVGSYLLDGVFIGANRSRYMMHSMLFCTFVIYLPGWYLLQGLGNTGLWLAFTAFNGARGLTLWACFHYLERKKLWLEGLID